MAGFALPKMEMPTRATALAGRAEPINSGGTHFVNGRPLVGDRPAGCRTVFLAMGCFWGAERLFWEVPGVWVTSVGYSGGFTPNPTYEETCTGRTGHAEVVEVVFNPAEAGLEALLRLFWENHDPTQGMRQGADIGSQYRSAIYVTDGDQLGAAEASRKAYGRRLWRAGWEAITTEIAPVGPYYLAEEYHQQYLARNPGGYCGLRGTGVSCPGG